MWVRVLSRPRFAYLSEFLGARARYPLPLTINCAALARDFAIRERERRNTRRYNTSANTRRQIFIVPKVRAANHFLSLRASTFERARRPVISSRLQPAPRTRLLWLGGYRLRARSQYRRKEAPGSRETETIFVRNQVERMILPTMKSTTSTAMAAVRDPLKKEGHRLSRR